MYNINRFQIVQIDIGAAHPSSHYKMQMVVRAPSHSPRRARNDGRRARNDGRTAAALRNKQSERFAPRFARALCQSALKSFSWNLGDRLRELEPPQTSESYPASSTRRRYIPRNQTD